MEGQSSRWKGSHGAGYLARKWGTQPYRVPRYFLIFATSMSLNIVDVKYDASVVVMAFSFVSISLYRGSSGDTLPKTHSLNPVMSTMFCACMRYEGGVSI